MKSRFFLVAIIGVGLGWLVGLSQSPVIAGVVTALVAAAAALVGALGGAEDAATDNPSSLHKIARLISPAPLAALMIGLAIGASLGLYARNGGYLSPTRSDHMKDIENVVARWESLGLERKTVVERLFEREFPAQPDAGSGGLMGPPGEVPQGLVAAGDADECKSLRRASKDELLLELRSSKRESVRSLAIALADTPDRARMGELLLEAVCPPQS